MRHAAELAALLLLAIAAAAGAGVGMNARGLGLDHTRRLSSRLMRSCSGEVGMIISGSTRNSTLTRPSSCVESKMSGAPNTLAKKGGRPHSTDIHPGDASAITWSRFFGCIRHSLTLNPYDAASALYAIMWSQLEYVLPHVSCIRNRGSGTWSFLEGCAHHGVYVGMVLNITTPSWLWNN